MTDPLAQAAAALAQHPARAEHEARSLILRQPADPRPRLVLASALRRQGKPAEALPILEALARQWPRAARTRYELGLVLGQSGQHAQGLAQLEAAVDIEPTLAEAWEALAEAAFAQGRFATELRARAALAGLAHADPALAQAAQAVVLEQFDRAEPILRQHLLARPDDAEALRLMAQCLVAGRAHAQAETLLRHALAVRPDFGLARFDLAHALFAAQQAQAALAELEPLAACHPGNPAYANLKAGCLALLGDEDGAERLQRALAQQFPDNPRIAVNHGHALRTSGARDAAIAAYRRATRLQPGNGEAWWSLANLKVGALDTQDEAAMRDVLAQPSLPPVDRMRLNYALGRRLEDTGAYAESFACYATGAALAMARQAAPLPDYLAQAEATRALCTASFFEARAGWGVADPAPIFVLGLPRSGSTLVEQILASHPDIEGTMELPYIGAIAARLAEPDGDSLGALTPARAQALGEEYLARAARHRRLGRPRFIDKMPNNFRHIGLIRVILPHARIIDVRRHPMAACFSGFKQLFAEGHDYSYDLAALGRYYRHYLAILRHFAVVQPGVVYTQIYEALVEAPEAQIAALLGAAGVDFAPECLRFHENRRAVRTVSSEQVRQPIYRSGLDHWQHYAPYLGPLREALGPALDDWRD